MNQIDNFISRLSSVEKTNNTTNLYFGNSRESEVRKNNLKVYLTKMKTLNPKVLILGEAPGYKGCRLSGIAFTSEKVIFENPFFTNDQYQFINKLGKLESEISATIVWSELSLLHEIPLLWNIFPFHPHLAENVNTNRTPTRAELVEGRNILDELLGIFEIQKILALGRESESKLTKIGIDSAYVRHPSNGGKRLFVEGFRNEIAI
jgi:uracil-DNA glycosylase